MLSVNSLFWFKEVLTFRIKWEMSNIMCTYVYILFIQKYSSYTNCSVFFKFNNISQTLFYIGDFFFLHLLSVILYHISYYDTLNLPLLSVIFPFFPYFCHPELVVTVFWIKEMECILMFTIIFIIYDLGWVLLYYWNHNV